MTDGGYTMEEAGKLQAFPVISPPEAGKVYRHYKGGTYVVLRVVPCTETGELRIWMHNLDHDTFHDRPKRIWDTPVRQPRETLEGRTKRIVWDWYARWVPATWCFNPPPGAHPRHTDTKIVFDSYTMLDDPNAGRS